MRKSAPRTTTAKQVTVAVQVMGERGPCDLLPHESAIKQCGVHVARDLTARDLECMHHELTARPGRSGHAQIDISNRTKLWLYAAYVYGAISTKLGFVTTAPYVRVLGFLLCMHGERSGSSFRDTKQSDVRPAGAAYRPILLLPHTTAITDARTSTMDEDQSNVISAPRAHLDSDGAGEEEDPAHRVVLPRDVTAVSEDAEEIVHVGTQGSKTTLLDGLQKCLKLRILNLRSNLLRSTAGIGACTLLEELELYDNLLAKLTDLDGLAALRTLDVSYNRIKSLEGCLQGPSSTLQVLYCASNRLGSMAGVQVCQQLRVLDLGANSIRVIEGLEECAGLEELWLGKNKITVIQGLECCRKLVKLDVQSNRLTRIGSGLGSCHHLQELYLGHNAIPAIEGLQGLQELHTLDLSANRITSVSGLEGLHSLTDLWLGYNALADFSALAFSHLTAHTPRLTTLYAEHNPVAADWEYRKRVARELPNLQQLDATAIGRR